MTFKFDEHTKEGRNFLSDKKTIFDFDTLDSAEEIVGPRKRARMVTEGGELKSVETDFCSLYKLKNFQMFNRICLELLQVPK